MELSDEEILNYYSNRWEIETYFRTAKNNLALQGYQVRSSKALERYLILQMFVAMYCINTGNGKLINGLRKYQAKKEADRIEDMIDILISRLKKIITYLDIPKHISAKIILSHANKELRFSTKSKIKKDKYGKKPKKDRFVFGAFINIIEFIIIIQIYKLSF